MGKGYIDRVVDRGPKIDVRPSVAHSFHVGDEVEVWDENMKLRGSFTVKAVNNQDQIVTTSGLPHGTRKGDFLRCQQY